MSQATVQFQLGAETVTSVLDIELGGETIITGDFGGLVAAGTVARLRGDVNLTGNLHVRGTLLCDPTGVNVNGNGFDIHTHDGTLNLVGTEKTAWCRWGDPVIGWQVGDRLAVAPTKANVYVPTEITWGGSWATITRPANSPAVPLLDGRVAEPEVANLSQTVTLRNMQRIMIHEATAPNPQTLKWIRVVDSGQLGVLGMYSIHFHQIYDNARGSLIEGVVVEGSKNHSFVPHGSHGITMRNCVAYNGEAEPFWWDEPTSKTHTVNNSKDTTWDHCLVLGGITNSGAAFVHGAGSGNKTINSAVACRKTGFFWPGFANQNVGGNVWEFRNNVAHNVSPDAGVRAWQNDFNPHHPQDTVIYNCAVGIASGAYNNAYTFSRFVIQGCPSPIVQAAVGTIKHFDQLTDGAYIVDVHKGNPSTAWLEVVRGVFTEVWYRADAGDVYSWVRFVDCGLTPADFRLAYINANQPGIHPQSKIEVVEAGVVTYRWAAGVWS